MTGRRNLRPAGPCIFLLLLCMLLAAGCSTSNENSSLDLVDAQGNHPAGWLAAFPGASLHSQTATFDYINNGTTSCTECHGDALNGGIANVSCMNISCHHNPAVTNWADPSVHGAAAKKAPGSSSFFSCQICHGKGFNGGLSGVTCFDCHGDVHPHPEPPWLAAGGTENTHVNTNPVNAPVCAQCHFPGSPNNPPDHPLNPAPAGTPPGCFNNTLCHGAEAGANHPVPFLDNTHFQATQNTFDSDCSNCHSVTGTSPLPAAPLCTVCHTAGSPLTLTNCISCHASPPAESAYPNIAGAHFTHLALNNGAGTPVSCDTCHNGLGSGTLNHYNRANGRPGAGGRVPPGDAAFTATYDAETGATSFDNATLSCSNVSCHGGQARSGGTPGTPLNWQSDTLVVNTSCTSCHAFGTTQFNSYNSGEHDQNAHVALGCLVCHNTTKLADPSVGRHFANLATQVLDTRASVTISGAGTSIPEGNYTPGATVGTGSCTPLCHNTRTW